MPARNRCPVCHQPVHPYAAGCPSCGADLDEHRRGRAARRRPQVPRPRVSREGGELAFLAVVLALLGLYAPLYGALFSLFVVWHSHRNSLTARRNVAIAGAALAILDLVAPQLLLPHI
jgi:hypothetical protein